MHVMECACMRFSWSDNLHLCWTRWRIFVSSIHQSNCFKNNTWSVAWNSSREWTASKEISINKGCVITDYYCQYHDLCPRIEAHEVIEVHESGCLFQHCQQSDVTHHSATSWTSYRDGDFQHNKNHLHITTHNYVHIGLISWTLRGWGTLSHFNRSVKCPKFEKQKICVSFVHFTELPMEVQWNGSRQMLPGRGREISNPTSCAIVIFFIFYFLKNSLWPI